MAEPILRWAGGKRQILDNILPRLPPKDKFNDYYEPFFGGGAVFFALEPENGYLNDVNPRLMNFYAQFRNHLSEIINENKKLDDELSKRNTEKEEKEFYYDRREEFNNLRKDGECNDEFREAVLFLFLNRTCWNGLYRTNEKGEFNVPMKRGHITTEAIERQLRHGYRVLQNTHITSQNFAYIDDLVGKDDLVFLDPPYQVEPKSGQFNKYNRDRFSEQQQVEVRNLALKLHKRGAYVMITNGPEAKNIYTSDEKFYSNFRIRPLEGKRRINSDSSQRTNLGTTEIIVTNIPRFWEQREFTDFR